MRQTRALSFCFALAFLMSCSRSEKTQPDAASSEPARPSYFKVDPGTAGMLTGNVRYAGGKPARTPIDLDQEPECLRLHKKGTLFEEPVVVNSNNALANVFVYIKTGLEGKKFEIPAAPVAIDQNGCRFHPRVLGIQTSQNLQVTNSDPLTHNVHPLAQVNREWNHSQAPGDGPVVRRFARPEIMIRVKCNIHGWMRAFIGVVDHPYFAATGKDGSFEIGNVPPGDYAIAAWHEKLGTQERKVTVPASGKTAVHFSFQGE